MRLTDLVNINHFEIIRKTDKTRSFFLPKLKRTAQHL
jgi:hypothetical protein